MDKKNIIYWGSILILIFLTISLRVMYLNTDFWYDEACSWFSAKQSFPFGIIDNLWNNDLQHTPLYFFLLHFWMKLFGQGEFAIKFLSVIFAIGTIPLVYTAAKKLSSDKVTTYATFVAAVSPLLVYFSAEARMYPIAVFLVMLSLNYLIDFENKRDSKSLTKLVVANILIPYTLVGGILYNISLILCYGFYILKNDKNVFKKYLKGIGVELFCLIPYFITIVHYAQMRSVFVIKHEGAINFAVVVDAVKNFFGTELSPNIYWPSAEPIVMTLGFAVLAILPCVYFVYGLCQGLKNSNGFLSCLYKVFILSFILSLICASAQINIFTVRYFLYLLAPMIILAIIELDKRLNPNHLKIFISLFVIIATVENIRYYSFSKPLKTMAFKAVKQEADNLELGVDDIIIMPFGSDAPYYFRKLSDPIVYNFDFHKEVRNPYNDNFYDKEQQSKMSNKISKYYIIKNDLIIDKDFSKAHRNYFYENVTAKVPKGRYVLLALYGDDAKSLVSFGDIKKLVLGSDNLSQIVVEVMLKKYLLDIRTYLDSSFNFLGSQAKGNYMYLLYQKR